MPRLGQGGKGSGGGFNLEDFLSDLTGGRDEANDANEARYQEGLSLLDAKKQEAQGFLEGQGQTGLEDIQRRATQDIAASGQDLTSRGLSGTTIGQGNERAIRGDAERSNTLLQERLNAQRLGVLGGIDSERLGFLERRSDEGPDLNAILPLLAQYGQPTGTAAGEQRANERIGYDRIFNAEQRRNASNAFSGGYQF
jgi:hypothetical protein